MRHPFDGINVPQPITTRRSWLRHLFAAIAGLFTVGVVQSAAPPARKVGGPEPSPEPDGPGGKKKPGPVTKALKEVGKISTRALGEEGAGKGKPKGKGKGPGNVTTLALNEE